MNIQDEEDPIPLSNYQFGGREVNTFSDNQPGDDFPYRLFEIETLPVDELLASGQRLCYHSDRITCIDGVTTATAGSNLIQSAHEGKQGPQINEIIDEKRRKWERKIKEPDDYALGSITNEGFDHRHAEGFLVKGAHTHAESNTHCKR